MKDKYGADIFVGAKVMVIDRCGIETVTKLCHDADCIVTNIGPTSAGAASRVICK